MIARVSFTTSKIDEAVPVLGDYFGNVRISPPRGAFAFDLEGRELADISAIDYQLTCPDSVSSVDTSGTLTFGQLRGGRLALGGRDGPIDTSLPWLYPQSKVTGRWDDVRMRVMSLETESVGRFARAVVGDDRLKLQFTSCAPVSQSLGRQWASLMGSVMVGMAEGGSLATSELVRASAFAHLASVLLATFPNSTMDAITRRAAHPDAALARAIEFMEANAHLPITVESIADAARLSVRGLQYAFRSAYGETPTTRLRAIRLARAHEELAAADSGRASVSGIALAWGFAHPGRFSQYYRQTYGRSPHLTLNAD